MEVSTEKSKIMTNSINNIGADISMNGKRLGEVSSFKYLGAIVCKDGTYSAEVRIRPFPPPPQKKKRKKEKRMLS